MHDGESANLQVIGRPVVRIDAREKVTGEALYSADRFLPQGVLYGKTLRSAHPHAEILRVDISEAEGLPGVRAVVTFRDAPQNPFEEGDSSAPEGVVAPVYVLNQVARHVGDEVAAVAAEFAGDRRGGAETHRGSLQTPSLRSRRRRRPGPGSPPGARGYQSRGKKTHLPSSG